MRYRVLHIYFGNNSAQGNTYMKYPSIASDLAASMHSMQGGLQVN